MLMAGDGYDRGDVNSDGRTDVLDAELILQLDAGMIHALPPLATPRPTPSPPATATITPTPTRTPAPGGDRSRLLVPDDLLITHTGCSTRGDPAACVGGATVAFYIPGLHEVVMRGYNTFIEMFEVCHAHTDMTTAALGLPFWEWPSTEEGSSFILAVSEETGPWGPQDIQTLQVWTDNMFGGMCANYRRRWRGFPASISYGSSPSAGRHLENRQVEEIPCPA